MKKTFWFSLAVVVLLLTLTLPLFSLANQSKDTYTNAEATATVTCDKQVYEAGEKIQVTVSGATKNQWVGIAKAGTNTCLRWYRVGLVGNEFTIEPYTQDALASVPALYNSKADLEGGEYVLYLCESTKPLNKQTPIGSLELDVTGELPPYVAPETEAPETEAPTEAPETEAPETEAPETEAPETEAPETEAPETEAPETEAPETEAPETEAPETEAPETEAPETEAPETEAPETEAPETEAPVMVVPEPDANGNAVVKLNIPKWNNPEQTDEGHDGVIYGDNVKTFGQHFVIPEGAKLTQLYFKYVATYGDGNTNKGTLKIYQWNENYATSVAGKVLYEVSFENHSDNASMTFEIPASAKITGDIVYEITYVEGTKTYACFVSKTGDLADVESYAGGNPIEAGMEFIATATISFAEDDTVDPMWTEPLASAGNHYLGTPKWDNAEQTIEGHYGLTSDAKISFGQKFTVAEGYKATSLYMKFLTVANDAATSGVIKVYQWKGDYTSTVASEPLYTGTITNHPANGTLQVALTGDLTGELYWEITATAEDAAADKFFKPFVATDDLDATTGISFIDGDIVTKEIVARVTLVKTAFPTTVLNEATTYVFWNEKEGGCGAEWNKTSFGQKFTVADGFKVSSITTGELLTGAADYVINIYEWKGSPQASIETGALLYSEEFNNGSDNAAYTVHIVGKELTGDLYWEVRKADGSATVVYNVSNNPNPLGLGATFIDGDYDPRDAKCIVTLVAKE